MINALTIGKVAKNVGLGVETVRFYEREGLIAPPPRKGAVSHAGYRLYPPETVARLRAICRAKELGFTLAEIRELLSLSEEAGARCGDVKERAEAKLAEIRQRLRDLRAVERSLKKLVAVCDEGRPIADCPIIQALEGK